MVQSRSIQEIEGLRDHCLPVIMAWLSTAYTEQHPKRYLGVTRAQPDTSTCWPWDTNHPKIGS